MFVVVFSILLSTFATDAASFTEYDVVEGGKLSLKRAFNLSNNLEKHEEYFDITGKGDIETPDYTGSVKPSAYYVGDAFVKGTLGITLSAKASYVKYTLSGRASFSGLSKSSQKVHTVVKMYQAVNIKQLNPDHLYSIRIDFTNAEENSAYCAVTSRESSFFVGGQEYSGGDGYFMYAEVTGCTSTQLRMCFTYDVIASSIVTGTNSAYVEFTCDSYKVTIRDYGASGSDLGSKVQKGNELAQEGNDISKQGNELEKKGNEIAQKGNEIAQEQVNTSKNIFDKISDFFSGFFTGIINALKSVFIPEDGYFQDFFTRLNDFFSEKLGMLYAPIGFFVNIMTAIGNADSVDPGIPFPGIKWNDTYLIEPQTISLSAYAKEFPELQEKLYFVTDLIMIGAVLYLVQNKLREVLHN